MQKQTVFVLLFAGLSYHSQVALLFGQCQTVAGNTWTEDDGLSGQRLFTLNQDFEGNITGSTYKGSCQSPYWPVTGTFRGDGTFTLTATNPSPGDPTCIAAWFTVDGTVNAPNCDTMSGTWTNSLGYSDYVEWTKSCDVPMGETTTSNGWGDNSPRGAYPTLALFSQVLQGPVNFGGRTVNETFPAQGQDTCWIPGSPYGPYLVPPGWASWPVGWLDFTPSAVNTWGYDYVGWTTDAIAWYRENRPIQGVPFPCGVQWQQQMNISCGGGTNSYQLNFMAAQMDETSISSNRAEGFAFRNW